MKLPVRSLKPSRLRLLIILAVVSIGHGLLLIKWSIREPVSLRATDKQWLSVNLSRPVHKANEPKRASVDDARLRQISASSVPAEEAVVQIPLDFTNSTVQQRDGSVTLDYQLVEIRGPEVTVGNMKLTLSVNQGKYESRQIWNNNVEQGENFSSGVADAIFTPKYLNQGDENDLRAEMSGVAQDQLSVIWNLRNFVAEMLGKFYSNNVHLWDIPVQFGSTIRSMHWYFVTIDDLNLPAGWVRAAKVEGSFDQDTVSRMTVWYALDLDFMPVRIETRDATGFTRDAMISTSLEKAN